MLFKLKWRANILEQLSAKCFIFVMAKETQGRTTSVAIFKLLGQSFKKSRGK